ECSTMADRFDYSLPYVKFFLHRNGVRSYPDIDSIAEQTFADSRIQSMVNELQQWPCYEITNHKQVDHPLHKLSFLADLGFTVEDPGISAILDRVLSNQSAEGPLQVIVKIPPRYGGSGEATRGWMACDAPVVLHAAARLNAGRPAQPLIDGIEFIAGRVADNGWRCFSSPEVGKFRGPGKKIDPCPYATMFSLKLLSLTPEAEHRAAKQIGIETLLGLWHQRASVRPYLFAMGSGFGKLKLPLVWYDILNVVDTLSAYRTAVADSRFDEMWQIIQSKRSERGFVPESIYLKSKDWEFGQKKEPSELLGAVIERIEKRIKG
ncbi:MAG: hypothetical protein KAU31_09535, partial [Spirochaetaceae bacterium]|nr:hypothetical protein [Spirochaetaceae bacterium]